MLNAVHELWRYPDATACMNARLSAREAPEWRAAIAKVAPMVQVSSPARLANAQLRLTRSCVSAELQHAVPEPRALVAVAVTRTRFMLCVCFLFSLLHVQSRARRSRLAVVAACVGMAAALGCGGARALQRTQRLTPTAPAAARAERTPRPSHAVQTASASTRAAPRRRRGTHAPSRGSAPRAAAASSFLDALLEDVAARAPVQPDAALINADFAPVELRERTFSAADMAALWIGLVICVPTWVLVGGLVELGFSALQGLSIIGVRVPLRAVMRACLLTQRASDLLPCFLSRPLTHSRRA
jgi:hypothetical protein